MTHDEDGSQNPEDVMKDIGNFLKEAKILLHLNDGGEFNEVLKFAIDGCGYKLSRITFGYDNGSIVKVRDK